MANEDAAPAKGLTCAVRPLLRDVTELAPLLDRLKENVRPASREDFPRGALLPDGRLDLCKQSLGALGVEAVTDALMGNTEVRSLLLGANQTGPAGGHAVAKLLTGGSPLEAVYLGCNRIGPDGTHALSAAIESHPTVRQLWLKRNAVGDEGVRHLAAMLAVNRTVRTLDLVSDDLTPAGIEALVAPLASPDCALQHLFVGGNALGVEGALVLAKLVRTNRSIVSLSWECNALGDDGAEILAAALRDNGTLKSLDLASNDLGARGVTALAQALHEHPSLVELELGGAAAAGVLGARNNHFGDEGAFALAAMIAHNRVLRLLDVSRAGVTEQGFRALLDAAENHPAMTTLTGVGRVSEGVRMRAMALACRPSRREVGLAARGVDLAQVKSVFRTPSGKPAEGRQGPDADWFEEPVPEVREAREESDESLGFTRDERATAERVLRAMMARPRLLDDRDVVCGTVRRLVVEMSRTMRVEQHRHTREARPTRTPSMRSTLADTGLNQLREAKGIALADTANRVLRKAEKLSEVERGCYVCKRLFTGVHGFYPGMCAACGDFNVAKREATADLTGRVALVTGGRIKIGFEIVLKLLRAGARVIATSRFPVDAVKRFAAQPDFAMWSDRLHLHGLDLRDTRWVEHFAQTLSDTLPRLDIVIQNAAQTVWRPSGFYADLLEGEARGARDLTASAQRLLLDGGSAPPVFEEMPDRALFPVGSDDGYGQPLDLRDTNSWRLRLGEVSTQEAVSVYAVNALAPFVLLNGLRAKMAVDPTVDKWVVNVSAVEGQFERWSKPPRHPHTNMAKAALNMLTRTSASDWARDRIYMTAVDTGWVSNENPWPLAESMAHRGFQPPLDVVDGAARVLDPIFVGQSTGNHLQGVFLKDYRVAPW